MASGDGLNCEGILSIGDRIYIVGIQYRNDIDNILREYQLKLYSEGLLDREDEQYS